MRPQWVTVTVQAFEKKSSKPAGMKTSAFAGFSDAAIRQFPTPGGMKSRKELLITPAFGNEDGALSALPARVCERYPVTNRLTQKTNVGIQAEQVDGRLDRF